MDPGPLLFMGEDGAPRSFQCHTYIYIHIHTKLDVQAFRVVLPVGKQEHDLVWSEFQHIPQN